MEKAQSRAALAIGDLQKKVLSMEKNLAEIESHHLARENNLLSEIGALRQIKISKRIQNILEGNDIGNDAHYLSIRSGDELPCLYQMETALAKSAESLEAKDEIIRRTHIEMERLQKSILKERRRPLHESNSPEKKLNKEECHTFINGHLIESVTDCFSDAFQIITCDSNIKNPPKVTPFAKLEAPPKFLNRKKGIKSFLQRNEFGGYSI
jgi:hypothetical protein